MLAIGRTNGFFTLSLELSWLSVARRVGFFANLCTFFKKTTQRIGKQMVSTQSFHCFSFAGFFLSCGTFSLTEKIYNVLHTNGFLVHSSWLYCSDCF